MNARARTPDLLDRLAVRLLEPLDALRSTALRAFGRPLRTLVGDPGLRVAWLGSVGLALSFVLARAAPALLLLLGPILLGVPHLMADLRYLVVRPGLHRRALVVALALLPCALAFFVPALEVVGVAMIGAAIAARGSTARRTIVALAGAAFVGMGRVADERGEIAFAHAHNAIAFVWLAVGAMRHGSVPSRIVVPIALFVVLASLLASGFVGPAAYAPAVGSELWLLARMLSPVDDPLLGHRFVLLFAFAQSAHYGVWLRLVPDVARGRRAPRSFRRSFAALRRDLGAPLLVIGACLALAFPLAALVDAARACDAYLRLALFHGPLELSVAGLLFAESRGAWTR